MTHIVFDKTGKILRLAECPASLREQEAGKNEFIMEGTADDEIQRIEFVGFDGDGQPINPRIVYKTTEEMARDKPKKVVIPDRVITKGQWESIMARITSLERDEL